MQSLDGAAIGAFVISGFFDGCADDDSSVRARHEIHLRRADHMMEFGAADDREHLSLHRASREVKWRNLSGPRARAVDYDRGVVTRSVRADAAGSLTLKEDFLHNGAG